MIVGRKNEETGEVTIDKITYHGCEKDLAPALGNHEEVFPFVCFRVFVISSFLVFMFSHFHVVTLSSHSSFSPLLAPPRLILSHSCL